jgi:hypothetical protein
MYENHSGGVFNDKPKMSLLVTPSLTTVKESAKKKTTPKTIKTIPSPEQILGRKNKNLFFIFLPFYR